MKISAHVLRELDLDTAIRDSFQIGIEHFPPLISDQCLSGNTEVLKTYLNGRLGFNYPLAVEVIGYPRRTFGIRPIVVSSLGSRAVYRALVQKLQGFLVPPSRGEGAYQAHKEFGIRSGASYIVDFDIASCYEYIDHQILLDELVLRSSNVDIPYALTEYLGEAQKRRLGIPQLSMESDLIADTYLDILDRRLRRAKYETSRFADDFRILSNSFTDASSAVERSSEYARDIGLVLSTEKTGIYLRSTLADRYESEEQVLSSYFNDAQNAFVQARFLMSGGYGDEIDLNEFDPDLVQFSAYHRIIADWYDASNPFSGDKGTFERLQGLLPKVLSILRHDRDVVHPVFLAGIASENFSRIEPVVKYIVSRADGISDDEDHWPTLAILSQNKRQSPWAKLWIIYGARMVANVESSFQEEVVNWVKLQVSDRHELVRAEAAWTLASYSSIGVDVVLDLYQQATELTRPLLAATLASIKSCSKQILSAVENDSPLMKAAIAWANHDQTS